MISRDFLSETPAPETGEEGRGIMEDVEAIALKTSMGQVDNDEEAEGEEETVYRCEREECPFTCAKETDMIVHINKHDDMKRREVERRERQDGTKR